MSKSGLECNVEEVFNAFCDLTQKEMNSAVRKALRAGAKQLQSTTKANAVSGIKNRDNTHWYDGKIIIYNDKIEDAVMISKIEGDFGSEMSQKVHVMGTRKSGSGTYRFRFLEKGTKERTARTYRGKPLRKPRKTGSIRGRWFFKNAQSTVFPNLPNIYVAEIDKAIQKINSTKL